MMTTPTTGAVAGSSAARASQSSPGASAGDPTGRPLVEQWRDLQERYLRTAASIDRELSAEHGLGLSDFEVLDLIAENDNPDAPCRMKDLSKISR